MLRSDLTTAFMLLTRLPVGWFPAPEHRPDLTRCVWAFPIVGLLVGSLCGACYWLASSLGVPSLLAAVWSLAAMLIITGALHEDGLADTADGFGGGRNPARKLEIMRDSRVGSYGALALLLSSLVRLAAITAMQRPEAVLRSLILAAMLGRAAMILPLLLLAPARTDGLGASMGRPPMMASVVGVVLAGFALLLCFPARLAVMAFVVAMAVTWGIVRLAHYQINGQTGDVLGACEVAIECTVLTVCASASPI